MTHALSTHSKRHLLALIALAVFFFVGGLGHFLFTEFYVSIVPDYIPTPALMVAISGLGELVGALGILLPRTRRIAGLGLMLLVIAVSPANVFMAENPAEFGNFPQWLLYARLPIQLAILLWIGYAMRRARSGYGELR